MQNFKGIYYIKILSKKKGRMFNPLISVILGLLCCLPINKFGKESVFIVVDAIAMQKTWGEAARQSPPSLTQSRFTQG